MGSLLRPGKSLEVCRASSLADNPLTVLLPPSTPATAARFCCSMTWMYRRVVSIDALRGRFLSS